MSIAPESVAPHWDVLWYLLVVIIGGGLVEFRFFLRKLSKSQDELKALHAQCQLDLKNHYISREAYKQLLKKREEMWRDYFFPHTHFPTGEVRINQDSIKRTQANVDDEQ